MRELTCIVCPRGCHLTVTEDLKVTGAACPRGERYAVAEMTDPRRTVTTSVYIEKGDVAMLSVKTSEAVPKACIEKVLEEAGALRLKAPVQVGQVLIRKVDGTQANLVATRRVRFATRRVRDASREVRCE